MLSDNTFENNKGVTGLKLNITIASAYFTIANFKFRDYNDTNHISCINFDEWQAIDRVTLDSFEFTNIKNSCCTQNRFSVMIKNIEVSKCTFVNNEANDFGGAVYADAHITGFSSNKFYNCRTTSENGEDRGCAICLNAMEIDSMEFISSSIFVDCSSSHSGSALFVICKILKKMAVDLFNHIRQSTIVKVTNIDMRLCSLTAISLIVIQ